MTLITSGCAPFRTCSIVVSPLIALMQDQVQKMQAQGVPACFLGSGQVPARRPSAPRLFGIFLSPLSSHYESSLLS